MVLGKKAVSVTTRFQTTSAYDDGSSWDLNVKYQSPRQAVIVLDIQNLGSASTTEPMISDHTPLCFSSSSRAIDVVTEPLDLHDLESGVGTFDMRKRG